MDTKATHADKVCQSCYAKCNRIKTKYKEHLSKLRKNKQSEIEFPFVTTARVCLGRRPTQTPVVNSKSNISLHESARNCLNLC